jgi:hypothetical protein
MTKMKISRITNEDKFNVIDLERSDVFLDNLHQFLNKIGIVDREDCVYESDGKKYDFQTYYLIYREDTEDASNTLKQSISDISEGRLVRYHSDDIELIITFTTDKIRLIFFCSQKTRLKINNALFEFCEIMR